MPGGPSSTAEVKAVTVHVYLVAGVRPVRLIEFMAILPTLLSLTFRPRALVHMMS